MDFKELVERAIMIKEGKIKNMLNIIKFSKTDIDKKSITEKRLDDLCK